jgi:hypothetical protein
MRDCNPGSARVSRVGEVVSGSRTFSKIVSARRRNQHARRVRYPERNPRAAVMSDATRRRPSLRSSLDGDPQRKCRIVLHSRSGI